jgi:lactate permease
MGGFGVPVAVTAPMLLAVGFPPLSAVLIPSIGHAWAITFGSLASSIQAMTAATGLSPADLVPASAVVLGLAAPACGIGVALATAGLAGVIRLGGRLLVIGLAMGATQYALATSGMWSIASFGAGLVGVLVGLMLARLSRRETPTPAPPGEAGRLWTSLQGYLAMAGVIALVQLVPGVRSALARASFSIALPATRTSLGFGMPADTGHVISPFAHTGTILLYATLVTFFLYLWRGMYTPGAARRIVLETIRKMIPVSAGIVTLVMMAAVMEQAGMIVALAQALAHGAGSAYAVVSPWIGALGAFVTGSNVNSNLVFSQLQRQTAELLGLSVPWILALQNLGGVLGSVLSPAKIIVGVSTVGWGGREGEVMRPLAMASASLLAAASLLTWLVLVARG